MTYFGVLKSTKSSLIYILASCLLIELVYIGAVFTIDYSRRANKQALCLQNTKSDRYQCWQDAIESALKTKGVDAALDEVAYFHDLQPEFANDCHAFVHIVGNEAYRLYAEHKDFALTTKVTYCAYGFFHGFLETLIQSGGTFAEARSFCKYAAGKLSTLYQAEDSCYHGVGHGVTDGSDPRAWGNPQAIIAPGLDSCAKIAPGSEQLKSCATGVFNSLAIMTIAGENRLVPDTANPYGLCAKQEKPEYRRACYEQMNTLAMHVVDNQFERAIPLVFLIADKTEQKVALSSLAAAAASGSLLQPQENDKKVAETCHQFAHMYSVDCIRGLLGGLMEHGKPGSEYVRAYAFCTLPLLTADEKNACLNYFMIYARSLYDFAKMQDVCRLDKSAWGTRCMEYALATFPKTAK